MSSQPESVPLSTEEKSAIDSYLLRLAAFFGLGNLLVIATVLGYIFFVLPQQVTEMAVNSIQDKNQKLNAELQQQIASTLLQAGKAQSDLSHAQTTIAGVKERLPGLEGKLEVTEDSLSKVEDAIVSLEARPATSLQKIVESIERYPDLQTVTERLPALEQEIEKAIKRQEGTGYVGIGIDQPESLVDIAGDLTVRNNTWSGDAVTRGYGNNAHVWTEKNTTCPDGTFVAGINVHYRGTCLTQCDADGGIIGEIQLICQAL